MRTSTLAAFTLLATAGPSLAAPVAAPIAARATPNGKTATKQLIKGRDTLELGELVARTMSQYGLEYVARDADESGAFDFTWQDAAGIAKIGKGIASVVSSIVSKPSGQQQQQQREIFGRDAFEVFAREDASGALDITGLVGTVFRRDGLDVLARENLEKLARADDDSGAFSIPTILKFFVREDTVARSDEESGEASISDMLRKIYTREEVLSRGDANGAFAVGRFLPQIYGREEMYARALDELVTRAPSSRRDLVDLFARAATSDDPTSAALGLGTVFSIGSSIVGGLINHFKNNGNKQQRRDALALEEFFARAVTNNDPEATVAGFGNVFNVGSSAIQGLTTHYKNHGNQQQRRDAIALEDLLARSGVDGQSGAITFSTIKDVGSLIGSAVSIAKNIFGGHKTQQQPQQQPQSKRFNVGVNLTPVRPIWPAGLTAPPPLGSHAMETRSLNDLD